MGVPQYFQQPNQNQQFLETFRCQPMAMSNRGELELGDKILLPPTALDQLARLKVHYPMMFEVTNPQTGLKTHCGVMEFSAPEGVAYLPYWMMEELFGSDYLQHQNATPLIRLRNITLAKGTYVQLRPHRTKFTELSNPRVVLEKALRNFSCLTKGGTITIAHGDEKFRLDVMDTKPGDAISIIETDVNVDFATPKDYVEPKRQPAPSTPISVPMATGQEEKSVQGTPETSSPSPSPSAGYFDNLGAGHSLSGKSTKSRRARRSPGVGTPPQKTGQAVGGSSGGGGQMLGGGGGGGQMLGGASDGKKEGRFNYVYREENGKKKLVKRTAKRGKTGGYNFGQSKGNSLK